MRCVVKVFHVPKRGNTESEYEDAFWPLTPLDQNELKSFDLAVADGATETSFSGEWARLLTRAFGKGLFSKWEQAKVLTACQRVWKTTVGSKPLPWYAEAKLASGAFAALIGLTITDSPDLKCWTSFAVGDSCMVQSRSGRIVESFPLKQSADFNSRPLLISSVASNNGDIAKHFPSAEGTWEHGDEFFLMTDALACWFLKRAEMGADPFDVATILTADEFANFVTLHRSDITDGVPAMRNDDVTLVHCQVWS